MASDDIQGVALRLTEEDIRKDCADMGIPHSALMAVAKRHRAQNTASQIADVLYIMMLAKSKGLNPIADNYSLIARPDEKGFSLTFNKEAALHVINNHPKVKKGAIAKRYIFYKGEKIDADENPEKLPGGWKLNEIDWDLTAVFEIEAAAGGILKGIAKFKSCFAAGRDGNPKFLWLRDPAGMTMKQALKDLANTKLDGALPDDDAIQAAQLAEGEPEVQRSLPAASQDTPGDAPAPATGVSAAERYAGIIQKAATLGINSEQILAAFYEQAKHGVTIEAFEGQLDKEIASRAKKAEKATKPTRARKADAEAPKAEAAKPEAPKKVEKPKITIVGTVDGISERSRAAASGKPAQRYLVVSIGGAESPIDMHVWHKSMFDAMFEAMGGEETVNDEVVFHPQKRVKVAYSESETKDDPPKVFYTVEEFEILPEEPPAPQEESRATPEPGPAEGFPMETEYVDPADSECAECGASFGIHLKTCSQFQDPHAKPPEPEEPPKPTGFLF